MPSLAHRLRIARIRKGQPQSAAAEALGVSIRTYKRWEAIGRPEDHQLGRVAEYLGEDLEELVNEVAPRSGVA